MAGETMGIRYHHGYHRVTLVTDRRNGKTYPIRLYVASPAFKTDTAGIRYHHGVGQTNSIKFILFACPSQVQLHHRHRRHPLPYHPSSIEPAMADHQVITITATAILSARWGRRLLERRLVTAGAQS